MSDWTQEERPWPSKISGTVPRQREMLAETHGALLHGQLQEGLRHHLMEAPAVSGASTYSMLCHAAKNEECRQAELKKRKQYQVEHTAHSSKKPPVPATPNNPLRVPNKPDVKHTPGGRVFKCWNCRGVGHAEKDRRKLKKESTGHRDRRPASTKMVQSTPVVPPPMILSSISTPLIRMIQKSARYVSMIGVVRYIVLK